MTTPLPGTTIFPGSPEYPNFVNPLDQNTGLLPSQYQLNLDKTGLNALQNQSLVPGANPWQGMALQGAQNQANIARGDVTKNAMQFAPGLSPAQRARAMIQNQTSGQANLMGTVQNNQRQIFNQAEGQRQNALMALPGMQIAASAPQQFNAQNSIQQNTLGNAANLSAWQEQMKAFGASQQARAMAAAGKK